jgi:L-fuconolactonase
MDAVGVRAAIVNAPELATVAAFVRAEPGRFAGLPMFGWPSSEPRGSVGAYLSELDETAGLIGVRVVLGPAGGRAVQRLHAGGFDELFSGLRRRDLAAFISPQGVLQEIHEALSSHPGLTFVVDHMGLFAPPFAPEGWDPWRDLPDVLALSQFPNVFIKMTGAPALAEQGYPFLDIWPRLHNLLDAFGIDRVMWGSDFTRCQGMHTYREAVDFVLLSDQLSHHERAALLSGTVSGLPKWPTGLAAPVSAATD